VSNHRDGVRVCRVCVCVSCVLQTS
jgi:hypothetical protein